MSTVKDSIRIKRGMSAELPESLPLGELAFCIDTRELWVGSGDGLPLKRVTNTEITQHLEEWNLLYTEVNERFETKYHDVSSQFAEKFLDLSEQFSDKYQDLNKQFSDKFEEICVQFSTKYDKLEEHYAKDLLANKLLSQANKESIDLLKRDIGTTENIEDLREINNQATETLEQLNAVKEELQNDVLVIKDIEKDLQKASVDYSGEHHENLKDSMDANVDFILGEFNSTNMTGEHITAHNTIQRHIKNAELKGHTEVNYIKDPSDKDLVMPYPFDDAQSIKLSDTKETGSVNIALTGSTHLNVLQEPVKDFVVPYSFSECYRESIQDTKETGSICGLLKGRTLVNLVPKKIIDYTATSDWDGFQVLVQNSTQSTDQWRTLQDLKPNTKYYISCYVETFEDVSNRRYRLNNENSNCIFEDGMDVNSVGRYQWISTTRSELTDETFIALRCQNAYARGAIKIRDIMIIEYQEGMENWDIPYFEGMQSVKMPVVTTTGKNLCKYRSNWTHGGLTFTNTENGVTVNGTASTYVDYYVTAKNSLINVETLAELNKLQVGTRLFLSNNLDKNSFISYTLNGESKYENNVTIQNGMEIIGAFVRFQQGDVCNNLNLTIQLEIGDKATTYEPYKSNILSCNEEVTLRGIGDVKDELNVATGELTQRIDKVVFDGSIDERWGQFDNSAIQEKTCLFSFYGGLPTTPDGYVKALSDKHIVKKGYVELLNTDEEMVHIYADKAVYFRILKSKLSTQNAAGFKEWLSQNPFTIQYQLATPTIKTVDFTIKNQNNQPVSKLSTYNEVTHIITSSKDGSLLPTVVSTLPEFPVLIKPNTKYSVINYGSANNHEDTPLSLNLGGSKVDTTIDNKLTVIRTPETLQNEVFKINGEGLKLSCVIVAGDMTGKELPDYFEGMKSVKKPVLTTTGKNLFGVNLIYGAHTYGNVGQKPTHGTGYARITNETGDYILVKPNTKYTFSIENNFSFSIAQLDKEGINLGDTGWLNNKSSWTITTQSTARYVGFNIRKLDDSEITVDEVYKAYPMFEESLSATTYEPHKSNILSCNEEVTLRGIDNIKDELDFTTGKLTRRIGEVVFDGSDDERWWIYTNFTNETLFSVYIAIPDALKNTRTQLKSNHPVKTQNQTEEFVVMLDNLAVGVKNSNLETNDLQGFRQWLSQNPITVQYQLATESIKTVDFTIKNQNNQPVSKLSTYNEVTHIDTSVEDVIKPTISHRDLEYNVLIKPNTKYSIITNPMTNDHNINPISFDLGGTKVSQSLENHCTVITTPQTLTHEKLIFSEGVGHKLQGGVMVLEGDKTGSKFNHFEGMKSIEDFTVKATNKNLVDVEPVEYLASVGDFKLGESPTFFSNIPLKPNTTYYVNIDYDLPSGVQAPTLFLSSVPLTSAEVINHNAIWTSVMSNSKGKFLNTINNTITTDSIHTYLIATTSSGVLKEGERAKYWNIGVYEVNSKPEYVKHQSNTLPVTIPLRSLPDGTRDTLNLITGEYIRNIGHDILDGSEPLSVYNGRGWNFYSGSDNNPRSFVFTTTPGDTQDLSDNMILCDKYISKKTLDFDSVWGFDKNHIKLGFSDPNSRFENIEEFKQHLENNPIEVCYKLGTPIVTKLDLVWEGGKLFAYDGTTHFFVDVEGGHLQPILDVDVPVNIVAELSRLRAEKEQLETSKAQLENQLEVITYRNTNLQSNLDSLLAENQDLKLQTYDLQTRSNVLQLKNKEMTKHQEKLQAENLELQKRASELAQTTMNLTEELHVVDSVRETGDLELLSSDFELDFRLMEIEFALDIPMTLSAKGVNGMARTPYEMAKTLILGGKYEREDMETKLKLYRDRGKITVAEYEELIALMDANELA